MGNSREPHSRPHSHAVDLIVVDEPTAELDRESASAVIEALRVATAHGATFVIATHDPEVTAIADHVIDLTQHVEHQAATIERPAAQDQDVVLTTTSLSKSYGEVHAVVDASIEVRAGQLAVVVGRLRSHGKSTLLMLLGGWSEPDAGTIGGVTSRAWADCAYVPQRFRHVPELTVAENVSCLQGGVRTAPRRCSHDLRSPSCATAIRPRSRSGSSSASPSRERSVSAPACCSSTSRPPRSGTGHPRWSGRP